jgi:predicted metal-binding protein
MQAVPVDIFCSHSKSSCVGSCSGYGSRTNCPPLIVLAFRAIERPAQKGDTIQ